VKKFLGITLVLLLGISLLGGCSEQKQQDGENSSDNTQQSIQFTDESQTMEQFILTGDKDLDNTLSGIDYDLSNLELSNQDVN
jgi:type IV pilus biogenesis protein CpaD/CtpE